MKKAMIVFAAVAIAVITSGCYSLRTPSNTPNTGKVFYATFFGISIESAVYGDGIIVQ